MLTTQQESACVRKNLSLEKKEGRFPWFLLSMTYVGSKTAGEKKKMGDDRCEQKSNEQKTRQGKRK